MIGQYSAPAKFQEKTKEMSLKGLTTIEWTAPIRAQANMATTSSTTMGM